MLHELFSPGFTGYKMVFLPQDTFKRPTTRAGLPPMSAVLPQAPLPPGLLMSSYARRVIKMAARWSAAEDISAALGVFRLLMCLPPGRG